MGVRWMLDGERLRVLLRQVVLAGAPLAALAGPFAPFGLSGCGPCGSDDRIYLLRAPDAETQALIDACRTSSPSNCLPLCQHVAKQPGAQFDHCELHQDRDGFVQVHVGSNYACVGGRRSEGLTPMVARHFRGGSMVGDWFARLAEMEAASVPAFVRLHAELTAHGAPVALIAGAQRAVRDEIRHTRLVSGLALRHGARPQFAPVLPARVRPLEAVAVENAAEGCVRETFAAVFALWQAGAARDPVVRSVLARIATDEVRHASIAWNVRRWAEGELSEASRCQVRAAEQDAVHQLTAEASLDLPAPLREVAGLPDGPTSMFLLARLRETLWRC